MTDETSGAEELFDADGVEEFAEPGDELLLGHAPANRESGSSPDEGDPEPSLASEHEQLAADIEPGPDDEDRKIANVLVKFGIDPARATDAELNMARSYRDIERLVGDQSAELGALRQTFDLGEEAYGPEEVPAAVAADPASAVLAALQQYGPDAGAAAYRQWVSIDPASASAQLANWTLSAAEQQHAAEVSALQQQIEAERQRVQTFDDVARRQAEAAQQAREEAYVASASYAPTHAQPSMEEIVGREWDEMEAPYRDGWNLNI